ncbi:unnamed protein product [Blepharisma stoltei]|uniref:Uncharacterized protein n=1 Tax=Blepharisma stoltei TaxID=1481888 RepID=A0AAU9IAE3_9CILI|nr:unnamed protein product [Blepharisma stoltei]
MLTYEGEFMESSNKGFWAKKERRSIKASIFEVYSQIYHNKAMEERSDNWQKVERAIHSIIWSLQMASLMWTPNLPITDWKDYMTLWKIVGYIRLDNICSAFGNFYEYLYLAISITLMISLTILVCTIADYHRSVSLPKILFIALKWFLNIWIAIFFIPSVVLFTIFLKYNFLSDYNATEYENSSDTSDFKITFILKLLIILSIIINFPLIIFHAEFSGEIRHSVSSKIVKSKAHSKIDAHIAFFTYFSSIFYILFDDDYMIYFQIAMMAFSIIIIFEIMKLLPYFSFYCNFILILQLFIIIVISFGFILGIIMDNALFTILSAIVLGPLSALFVIQYTRKLKLNSTSSNPPAGLAGINSQYQLEKSLRNFLCGNDIEHKDHIIYLFETFFTEHFFHGDKLQVAWATNYCLFTLKDKSLAKLKLSKSQSISKWNLEAEFQEFLCNKNIQNSLFNEKTQFISYFYHLNIIKKKDEKLCVNLLNFWEELISLKPDLKGLTIKLNWLYKRILLLNNQYSELTTKFLDSKEILALHASYAKDVLYDFEKSNLLENKLRGLSAINFDSKKFSYFRYSNGILVISGDENNFGKIIFSNLKAAEIMKSSIINIEGSNIMNFIHAYYSEKIKEEVKWAIHFSSSSEIDLSKGFFLNIPGMHLIECIGKATLTSIDNCAVIILNFQRRNARREAALTSENGEILCYSENFPKFARKFNDNLQGCNIKNLFPGVGINDVKFFIPYHLPNFEKETILIKNYIKVYNAQIYYVFLINDETELEIWKHKNHPNHFFDEKDERQAANYDSNLLSPKNQEFQGYYQNSYDQIINSEMNLNQPSFNNGIPELAENRFSDKLSEEKSQISEHSRQKKYFQMLSTSSRSINILHIAFILSIIAVLSTNIAVLFYASSSIELIRNMELPIALAEAEAKLQKVAYGAQIIWALSNYGSLETAFPLFLTWSGFPSSVDSLKASLLYITSNLPKWNYCSSRSILTDESIDLWDSGKIKKMNLLDMLSKSVQYGYDMARKYNNSEDYKTELNFIVINGYGIGFEYCNTSLYEIMECQKSINSGFKYDMFFLLILGIGVLALCVCIMIPFCWSTIQIENDFWGNLRRKVYDNHAELRNGLLERLRFVHSQSEIFISNRNHSKKRFNFRNSWKYIWRICIYFIIVTAFSIVNITYLYEKCTNYLSYRPEMMKELIRTKILQNTFAIWSSELLFHNWGFPPLNKYLQSYPFVDPIIEFQETLSDLEDSKKLLRNPKYSPILSDDFKKKLYENNYQVYTNYLTFGSYSAEEVLLQDGYLVAFSNIITDFWVNWIFGIVYLNTSYDELANEMDSDSQKVIDAQVAIIVWAFILFIITSVTIYFSFYYVFFRKEKQYLQKINSIMKIIP